LRNNLDSSLSVNYGSTKFLTSFSAAFKYGKNLKSKASKDRINLNFQAQQKLGGAKKTVNYTLDFNFPAKVGRHGLTHCSVGYKMVALKSSLQVFEKCHF